MGAMQADDACYPAVCRASVKPFDLRLKLFAAATRFGPRTGSGIGPGKALPAACDLLSTVALYFLQATFLPGAKLFNGPDTPE
jgi:hypothetical protein